MENEISHKIIGAAIEIHKCLAAQDYSQVFMKAVFVMHLRFDVLLFRDN
nr:hypothetical protein [Candidatus Protochlamydia naegleriophila]